MATTLTIRAQTATGVTERTFARTPVFIGRKVGPGHFDVEDRRASKLHASIDIREDRIWLRDAASTNGTVSGDRRLEPDRWTDLGNSAQPVEFQIGGTTFAAWGTEVAEDETGSISVATLSALMASSQRGWDTATVRRKASSISPRSEVPTERETVVASHQGAFDLTAATLRLTPACHDASSALLTLGHVLKQELDLAPPDFRAQVCEDLLASHPSLAQNRGLVALFESYGLEVLSAPKDAPNALAATALAALQDIAVWYTGESRELKRAEDVAEFHQRLRTALDDLLLGYAPLLSGLNQFENQMAIRSADASTNVPGSAAELAALLLDWQTDNRSVRAALRASFAELMMHQVALLRGVMRGVKTLLAELSPEVIEKAAEEEGGRRLFGRLDPWTTYKRRHSDLSDEENERFRILFGTDFVNEYRQFSSEARAEDAGADSLR
jgi:type VI secretion system protein ImpI